MGTLEGWMKSRKMRKAELLKMRVIIKGRGVAYGNICLKIIIKKQKKREGRHEECRGIKWVRIAMEEELRKQREKRFKAGSEDLKKRHARR